MSVCVCLHCIFFIHSSVDGHLGCFCGLAIVVINSAAMNTGVALSFELEFPLYICPEVGLLHPVVAAVLVF